MSFGGGSSGDGGALSATLTQLDTSNLYTRIVLGV